MSKISLFFLLLLLIDCFSCIETELYEEQKQAVEINISSKVEYDQNNNYFQFKYEGSNKAKIFFKIDFKSDLYLTYPKGEKVKLQSDDNYRFADYVGNLTENGTYFLEVFCKYFSCELGGSFNSLILGDITATIDLSKNVYYRIYDSGFYQNKYDIIEYKVSGLTEDKYVYFMMKSNDIRYYRDYFPYYPDEPYNYDYYSPYYHPNLTIFEVFNIGTKQTTKHVKVYKFEKDYEYIIRIYGLIYYNDYRHQYKYLYYLPYFFSPITYENFKLITGEEDFILSEGPMLGLIKPLRQKNFSLFLNVYNREPNIFISNTPETIENQLEDLTKIGKLIASKSVRNSKR